MGIALLLVLAGLFVGCALVKHRVHTLNLSLVPPMAPSSSAGGNVVHLDAYRHRRPGAAGYRSRSSHSAS